MTTKIATGADLLRNPDIAKFFGGQAAPPAPEPVKAAATPVPPIPQEPEPFDTTEPEAPDSSKENYLADLKKLGVTTDDAAKIVDAMLFQGVYEEDIQLTKKLAVRFRTRDSRAADRLNEAINKENPQFTSNLYTIIGNYNLASSLVRYGPHQFDPGTEEGFEKTLHYIKTKIPLPVYQLLVSKLSKWDEKLTTIMRDGCVEDFF